jgi:hypothetical protein
VRVSREGDKVKKRIKVRMKKLGREITIEQTNEMNEKGI